MAIAPSVLTSAGDNTDRAAADPYTTASVSPTGPVLMGVCFASDTTPATEPALPLGIVGCGLSWAHVADIYFKDTGSTVREKTALYQGTGTPSAGVIQFSFGFTCIGCEWIVCDIPGADPASPIVGGQVITTAGSTAPAGVISAALPAGAANDAADRCFSLVSGQNAVASYTPRASWTELAEVPKGTPSMVTEMQWRSDAFEQTGSATNGSASTFRSGLIVVEVAIAPTGGGGGGGSHKMLALTGVG